MSTTLPEVLVTRLPPGTAAIVALACARHGIRPADYLRVALRRQLQADRLGTPALDIRTPRLADETTGTPE